MTANKEKVAYKPVTDYGEAMKLWEKPLPDRFVSLTREGEDLLSILKKKEQRISFKYKTEEEKETERRKNEELCRETKEQLYDRSVEEPSKGRARNLSEGVSIEQSNLRLLEKLKDSDKAETNNFYGVFITGCTKMLIGGTDPAVHKYYKAETPIYAFYINERYDGTWSQVCRENEQDVRTILEFLNDPENDASDVNCPFDRENIEKMCDELSPGWRNNPEKTKEIKQHIAKMETHSNKPIIKQVNAALNRFAIKLHEAGVPLEYIV